jgi:hypothetical protein
MQPLSLPTPLGPAKIYLYSQNVDMRKSFDGLHAIVQSEFQRDIRLGDLFLFLNRRLDRIKLLHWDRDGLVIWMKKHVSDCPATFLCTRIGQRAHNRARWLVAASGMDASTRICGPRRCPMSPGVALIAPPRARRPSEA